MAAKNKSNELKIIRVYDAPVRMVWDAWVDPDKVGQWWGPRGFTITTQSKDVKAGGHWNYIMHGPDGVDYPNKTRFLEVDQYSRLVYDHGGNDEQAPLFRVTVLFTDLKSKTKMEMTMSLPTAEKAEETRKFVKKVGGESTWDRLAEYLAQAMTGEDKFFINRTFEISINKMFEMWTNPKHISQWLPPTGFKMEFIRCDIKTGGSSFYFMTGGNGAKMYGRGQYLEIQKPHRIVYAQQFCDENEKITRHPMMATWPESMVTTVLLSEEGPDRTRVTVTWEVSDTAKADERETFAKFKGGMTQGWTGSFDKLEEYLDD